MEEPQGRGQPDIHEYEEQQAPDYLSLNPQGLVPALEIDGDVLTQSLAICEYLDERYPEPPFLPADPLARAKVRAFAQVMRFYPPNRWAPSLLLEALHGTHRRRTYRRHLCRSGNSERTD